MTKLPGRILFVITGMSYGGAEVQVSNLAIVHSRLGREVHVVSLTKPKAFVDKLKKHGVSVSNLNMSRGVPDIRAVFRLKKIISRFKPDIVHAHMVHAILLSRFSRVIGSKVPALVCTAHNTVDGGRLLGMLYRLTDRWADLTTNVCRQAVERFVNKGFAPASKMLVVHNGIDVSNFDSDSRAKTRNGVRDVLGTSDRFTWLTVGRADDEQKNYPLLLKVFSKNAFCNSILLIVGSGIKIDELKRLVRDYGIENRVLFLGLRSDVADLMIAADAFVLASKWEGLPMVLLEASAAELPVVCTNVGGNIDIVLDGKTGWLVESENETALADQMDILQEMSVLERQEIGHAGRRYVSKKFDMQGIVNVWTQIYSGLLQ